MIFIYLRFPQKEDGTYHAIFPDLACCEASGETLDDAIDNANDAPAMDLSRVGRRGTRICPASPT